MPSSPQAPSTEVQADFMFTHAKASHFIMNNIGASTLGYYPIAAIYLPVNELGTPQPPEVHLIDSMFEPQLERILTLKDEIDYPSRDC